MAHSLQENEIQHKLSTLAEGDPTQFIPLESLPKKVKKFIGLHSSLIYNGTGKVRCELTGHDMPCTVSAMASYTSGKKYQRLREHSLCDFDRYKPHIVASTKKGHKHQLFCTLTLRHISRQPQDVDKHMNGKRYIKALAKYNDCQSRGVPFKPNSRVPRKDKLRWDSDQGPNKTNTDSEASDEETDDSMSDLYPAGNFNVISSEEVEQRFDEDEHVENMEVEEGVKIAKPEKTIGKKQKSFKDESSKIHTSLQDTEMEKSEQRQPKKLKQTR